MSIFRGNYCFTENILAKSLLVCLFLDIICFYIALTDHVFRGRFLITDNHHIYEHVMLKVYTVRQ